MIRIAFAAGLLVPLVFSTALSEHFLLPKAVVLALAGFAALAAAGFRPAAFPAGHLLLAVGFALAVAAGGLHPNGFVPLLTVAGGAALSIAAGPEAVRAIPPATLGATFAVAGYGCLQFAGLDPIPWHPADLAGRTALCSTLGNVNWLAGWLALAAPLLLAGLLSTRGAGRGAYGAGLALAVPLLLAARSRAALLALLFAAAWLALRHPAPRRRKAAWAAALLFALLAVDFAVRLGGGYSLADRLRFSGAAFADRTAIWNLGLRMAGATGSLGGGAGAFARLYPDFLAASGDVSAVARSGFAKHAHDDFLQIYVEAGALGLAGFLLVLVGGLLAAANARGRMAICAGATLAAAIPLALLDTVLFHPALWLAVTFAGLGARQKENENVNETEKEKDMEGSDDAGGAAPRAPRGWVTDPPDLPDSLPGRLLAVAVALALAAMLWLAVGALRSSLWHANALHLLHGKSRSNGEEESMRHVFAEAARLDPFNAEAAYLAGAFALKAGHMGPAASLLRRAAGGLSEPGLFLDLAIAAENGGFPGEGSPFRLAARWRAKAAALFTGPELLEIFWEFLNMGELDRAERTLFRAIRLDDAADRLNLGLTPLLDRLIDRRLGEPSAALYPLLLERARHAVAERIVCP